MLTGIDDDRTIEQGRAAATEELLFEVIGKLGT
jgi:hypothetical protein